RRVDRKRFVGRDLQLSARRAHASFPAKVPVMIEISARERGGLLSRLKTRCATQDLLRRLKTRCAAREKMRVMTSLTVGLLRRTLLFFALICSALPAKAQSGDQQLRWGGDAEGGAPYLLPDPKNPREIIGFEIDLMNAVGKQINRKSVFVQ